MPLALKGFAAAANLLNVARRGNETANGSLAAKEEATVLALLGAASVGVYGPARSDSSVTLDAAPSFETSKSLSVECGEDAYDNEEGLGP